MMEEIIKTFDKMISIVKLPEDDVKFYTGVYHKLMRDLDDGRLSLNNIESSIKKITTMLFFKEYLDKQQARELQNNLAEVRNLQSSLEHMESALGQLGRELHLYEGVIDPALITVPEPKKSAKKKLQVKPAKKPPQKVISSLPMPPITQSEKLGGAKFMLLGVIPGIETSYLRQLVEANGGIWSESVLLSEIIIKGEKLSVKQKKDLESARNEKSYIIDYQGLFKMLEKPELSLDGKLDAFNIELKQYSEIKTKAANQVPFYPGFLKNRDYETMSMILY